MPTKDKNKATDKHQAVIQMYSKGFCPYCVRAKQLFKHKGVEFEEITVGSSQEKYTEMLTRSNGARTVPQIFIGDHHVGGCDELYGLHRQNKLDALLFPRAVDT